MANWDVFRELENLRKEIDAAFRGADYLYFVTLNTR